MNIIRAEGIKLLNGMRAILLEGNIVIASEQQGGDFRRPRLSMMCLAFLFNHLPAPFILQYGFPVCRLLTVG